MDLRCPRRKKLCKTPLASSLLPVVRISESEICKFTGEFDGLSVTIKNQEDKERLNRMGYFGKPNLSKSLPPSSSNPRIIRKRQFLKRKHWGAESTTTTKTKIKIIVIPDSESEDENYFSNVKAEYQIDFNVVKETLNLSLVEAYFLSHDVKCLNVLRNACFMDDDALWTSFSTADEFFAAKYTTYLHFRRKNWITKTGIKFGGDFLLYKDGPPYCHASYVVIIDVLDEDLQRRKDLQIRSMKLMNLVGLNRLCETAGKELLICQLIWPRNVIVSSVNDISNISVNEVIMRRWIPSKEINSETRT